MPVTLTLDSQLVMGARNTVGDGWGSCLRQLCDLESRGLVALGISSRFLQDKPADPNNSRRLQDLDEARRLEQ